MTGFVLLVGAVLCVAAVAAYVMKDNTDAGKLEDRLRVAETFYQRETERASEYARKSLDTIESENARYEALKARIETLETKDKPINVRLTVDKGILVDTVKPVVKKKTNSPRMTQ